MMVKQGLTLACLFAVAAFVQAEDRKADTTDKLPLDDQYVIKAVVFNNATIQTAKLVESRSENEAVKAFAKQVIEDHNKASEELGRVIKDRKLSVVAGLEKETREEIDRLSKLKGAEFDREYLANFIKCHEKCLSMCKSQVSSGKEEAASKYAKDCCTKLEEHLKKAKELKEKVSK
jgi:putative membrane protein